MLAVAESVFEKIAEAIVNKGISVR